MRKFRKEHPTQHAMFWLLWRWQHELANSEMTRWMNQLFWWIHPLPMIDLHLILSWQNLKFLVLIKLVLLLDYWASSKQLIKVISSYNFWSVAVRSISQSSMGSHLFLLLNYCFFKIGKLYFLPKTILYIVAVHIFQILCGT